MHIPPDRGLLGKEIGPCQAWYSRAPERLIDVRKDVVDVLDADGDAYHFRRDAGCGLCLGAELGMRGAGRVDGERFRIADVGKV